jgi:hypothetical protein
MTKQGIDIPHPKLRGEWAELRFMQRAAEHGLVLTKPWGDSAPYYDFAVDHHGHFLRVQVKCTRYKRQHSYVCTICASHVPYQPDQLDFIAALIIPTDTWYILPLQATRHQSAIVLSPHLSKSKYTKYQEAWHLLLAEESKREPER